jgi:ligand-binding sensor domain-containing protein
MNTLIVIYVLIVIVQIRQTINHRKYKKTNDLQYQELLRKNLQLKQDNHYLQKDLDYKKTVFNNLLENYCDLNERNNVMIMVKLKKTNIPIIFSQN